MPNGTTITVTEQGMKSGRYQYNSSLVNVVIPGSVKVINGYAFGGCQNLRTVTIDRVLRPSMEMLFQIAII